MAIHLSPYKQLYELLKRHILSGVYPEGSILPSEHDLCRVHGITRPTVRRALDALASDGYITKHQGKGSIVHLSPKEVGILSIAGTTSALGETHVKTHIITGPEIRPWPESFFFPLSEIVKESGCIYLERLRHIDDKPVFFDTNYLPNIDLPRFCNRSFENRSLFEILRNHYGVDIRGGEQRLRALPADRRTAKYLKINTGMPVLHLVRKLQTNKPSLTFYSSLFCNTSQYSLHGSF